MQAQSDRYLYLLGCCFGGNNNFGICECSSVKAVMQEVHAGALERVGDSENKN